MNNVINFTVNINGNATQVSVELNDTVRNLVRSVTDASTAFDGLGKKAFYLDSITNIVNKASQAFGALVGSSMDFEMQQANLRTLLNGDAKATENLVKQIREYGKATVYDKSGLIEAQKTMMSFGIEAERAFGKLKQIGDIALGDKQKMQSLALAFSQMSSTGKLLGQDYNQMVNAGFNPLLIISQKTGKSLATLKEEMGKGKITVKQVEEAFEAATAEGGLFFKGAETAAETTAGKIAKVKDNIEDFKIELFEATHGATAWIAEIGNMMTPISMMFPLFSTIFQKIGVFSRSIKSAGGLFSYLKIKGVLALTSISGWITRMLNRWLSFVGTFFKWIGKVIKRFYYLGKEIRLQGGLFSWLRIKASNALARVRTAIKDTRWKIKYMGYSIKQAGGFFPWLAIKAKMACKAIGTAIKGIPVIGWIIAIGTAVTALFAILYTKFEGFRNWLDGVGSLVVLLLGPFGILINLVTSFIKHWESVKQAFTAGGIIAGLKRIGFVLVDFLVKPVIALLNLLAKIPGLGHLAQKGSEVLSGWRDKLDEKTKVEVLDPKEEGKKGAKKKKKKTTAGTLGNTAGTVAGKAQQIHITLGNMVGTMNFNGNLRENASDVERQLTEMMARILGMAETAA